MSIIEEKLKNVKVGSQVRLYHQNGTYIDGIVIQNDGIESLAVEIKKNAILRYSTIAAIEYEAATEKSTAQPGEIIMPVGTNQTAQTMQSLLKEIKVPASEKELLDVKFSASANNSNSVKAAFSYDKLKAECEVFSSNLFEFENAFKELDRDTRMSVQGQLSKIRVGFNNHDNDKIEQGVNEIWSIIKSQNLDYDPRANLFVAYGYVLAEMYVEAIDAFYYGNDIYKAFSCALSRAIHKGQKDMYSLAAIYAAIYILTNPKGENIKDAVRALDISSAERADISGIEYVLENADDKGIGDILKETIQHFASYSSLTLSSNSPADMVSEIKKTVTTNKIYKAIDAIYVPSKVKTTETTVLNASENSSTNKNDDNSSKFEVDVNKEYVGRIVSFNFFERKGKIENDMGVQYSFESKNIADANFRAKVDSLNKKDFEPIVVQFHLLKFANSFEAIKIKRCKDASVIKHGIAYANYLFTNQKYNDALVEYDKMLDTNKWEDAFIGMMNCYLALEKARPNVSYMPNMKQIADKYASKVTSTIKTLSVMHQYYMKAGEYQEALEQLDLLIAMSDEDEYKRILYCVCEKARCYNLQGNYNDAIEQYEYWLNQVNENKYSELYLNRDTFIYPEIADLYFKIEDYDNAEKYILLSLSKNKKSVLEAIEQKRTEIRQKQKEEIEEDYTPEIIDDTEEDDVQEENEIYDFGDIDALISEYSDEGDFSKLGLSDVDIINKAFSFDYNKLYCLITYLSAAARCAKGTDYEDTLNAAEYCVRAATGNLINEEDILSTNVVYHYELFKDMAPEKHEFMLAAAALRVFFEHNETLDYEMDSLRKRLENTSLAKDFPALLALADRFIDYKNQTGCGISKYADYKSDGAAQERILEAARTCRDNIEGKVTIYENKGRLRRTRQILFINPDSLLRQALDAACDNDTSNLKELKQRLKEMFVKPNKEFSYDNVDHISIQNCIDTAWDKAREMMVAEKRHVNRPYERLINPKRRNVSETIYRVLKCVFDWMEIAERANDKTDYLARFTYSGMRDEVIEQLKSLRKQVKAAYTKDGFDWCIDMLKRTLAELTQKLTGEYDEKQRKYMYIDFLRTDHILLNYEFQPEIYATFSDMSNFNVLHRIEEHINSELPSFTDRIDDLFSNDISKNNLRSASLIKEYGDDMGISEISEHSMYNYLEKCISVSRERLKDMHEDFLNQLELYQSYGALSDISGEKTAMRKKCDIFFRICFTSCDFGFYASLVNNYNEIISSASETIAERLNRQLDELELNPKYDWGIYSKDEIKTFISERNFSVAENMMNCIRRNDTKELPDLSIEPFGYLTGFLNEHSTNYKAVSDVSISLELSIKKYTGKNNLEIALKRMTNNASKDVKGGKTLIENWILAKPAGKARVEKLLNALGFNNLTVTEENGAADDSYIVNKAKQTGRVSYHYPLPAFSSVMEQEGVRVVCLYGKYDADRLIDKYKEINTTSKHTIVLLDYALKMADRKHLARKIKAEKSFSKTFILIDRVVLYYLALHYQSNTIDKALMSITMPFSYYQPFSATSKLGTMPPELYTGRTAELRSIEDPNGCNLVYGGRQLGKSALLSMAAKHIDGNANGDRAIVIDIVNKDYKAAAKSVSENLVDANILPAGSECDDWETLARLIGRRLADDNPDTRIGYLLLMLDEADAFIDSCKNIGYTPISVFKNLPEGRFKLVMAGLHNLSNFNRSILHNNSVLPHLESIIVRPFQRPEGTELLTHALAYLGFRFEPDVIQLILARTNYFPGLIQLYCQKLLEAMQNDDYAGYSEINSPPYEVTENHIKKVLSDKSFTEEIDKRLWMTLTVNEDEGSYYMIIALILAYLNFDKPEIKGHSMADIREIADNLNIKTISGLDEEQLTEVLTEMWDLNIITADETPNGNRYMFSSEGFRDLLGSKEKVEQDLEKYIQAGE